MKVHKEEKMKQMESVQFRTRESGGKQITLPHFRVKQKKKIIFIK